MKHRYEKPNQLLAEFVRTVLVMEGFSEPDSGSLPVFTNGMPVLFCKTQKVEADSEHIAQLALFGKSPNEFWIPDHQSTIIAYFFQPFTLASLFNIPARKLSETPFELSNWSPHTYNALRTQLMYATETSRKTEVLDHLLIQQLNENKREYKIIQHATERIMNDPGKEILSEILEELSLNERTFQRMFKKYVGVTPTQFRRICQFQVSFGQLHSNQFDKISEVAYDNGFADQSHFIRSFREFTEVTPNEYLKKGLKNKKQ